MPISHEVVVQLTEAVLRCEHHSGGWIRSASHCPLANRRWIHCSLIFQLDVLPWGLYIYIYIHIHALHYITLHFITWHWHWHYITFHTIPYRCDSFKTSPVFPSASDTFSPGHLCAGRAWWGFSESSLVSISQMLQDTSCWKMVPFEHFKQKEVRHGASHGRSFQATSKLRPSYIQCMNSMNFISWRLVLQDAWLLHPFHPKAGRDLSNYVCSRVHIDFFACWAT